MRNVYLETTIPSFLVTTRKGGVMGFLADELVAKVEGRTIEVRTANHLWRGLIYRLFVDGAEVSEAQNFWKIPSKRTLEADVELGGTKRHIVVAVKQRVFSTDFSLSIDGVNVPMSRTK